MATIKVTEKSKFPAQKIYDTAAGIIGSDIEAPRFAPSAALNSTPGNLSVGLYKYKTSFVTAVGETLAGPESAPVEVFAPGTKGQVDLTAIPIGPTGTTSRKVYRTEVNKHSFKLLTTIADNTTSTYTDNVADASLGAAEPTVAATSSNYSVLANAPFLIQVDTLAVGTTVKVEMKAHPEAEWAQSGVDLTNANTPSVGVFDGARPNYVRLRRSAGVGDVKGYAQF